MMDGDGAISYVELNGEKPTLVVDGNPFLYLGTQLSPHRLQYFGWKLADMEKLFQTAADNAFTVLAVPVLWNWIEPQENRFDWGVVDTFLDYAAKYAVRIELLWFGSDVCSVSDPSEGCPNWAIEKYELVQSSPGTLYTARDFNYVTYRYETFRKLDKCDRKLLAKERNTLGKMMDRVGERISCNGYSNVVIGVQLLNESTVCRMRDNAHAAVPDLTRSFSRSANERWESGGYTNPVVFNTEVWWSYLNGLGEAVKKSRYPVWTRVNCNKNYEGGDFVGKLVSKNESMRNATGTFIDFIGDDPYTTQEDWIYEYGRTSIFSAGSNLPMIMENSGRYEETDRLVFNAMAGNACYNIWELISSGDLEGETGFYWKNHRDKSIRPKWYQKNIRNLNGWLRRNWRNLATLRSNGTSLAYFNRLFQPICEQIAYVEGREVYFVTSDGAGGIVSADREGVVFMSTGEARFSIPELDASGEIQSGYYNEHNNWVTEGTIPCQVENGRCMISLKAYDCVRFPK